MVLIDEIADARRNLDFNRPSVVCLVAPMNNTRDSHGSVQFGLATLLGALIWLLSPVLTGQREPWDDALPFYLGTLFLAGFIPACVFARRFWLWAGGVWLGQTLAFLVLILQEPAPLWPLGIVFLAVFSLLSLAGAALGAGLNRRLGFKPRRLQSFILPLLAAWLNGCVFHDNNKLPKQPLTTRQAGLADFNGAYRLIVEPERQRGESNKESFGFLELRERKAGDILRLEPFSPKVSVRYESGTNTVETGTIDTSSPLVRLEHGRLIYRHPAPKGVPIVPGAVFSSGQSTTLFFGELQNLILVTDSWEAAAPLLILPFHESKRRVYRFERIAK